MTNRQKEILTEIIRLYADSAEPVSSRELANSFGLSSATIRAEMSALEDASLIFQPHISAGRVPTDKGYRYFVNNLVPTGNTKSNKNVLTITKRVDSLKDRTDSAIKIAAETLSDLTGNMTFATLSDSVYFHGMSQLFSQPEFLEQVQALQAARFIDAIQEWLSSAQIDSLQVFIGDENPVVRSSGLTMMVNRFSSPYSDQSYIGIIGPTRQSYDKVINLVEGTSKALEEVFKT
ncbi:MAG: transcriptional regulator [Candidatus Saccharibacteria bacterium]|jgi:heat-inducible transcriptional repressor|nr:transcriptional regulator [Patescibacteria group bacterium]